MTKSRVPLQVSPLFRQRIKEIQDHVNEVMKGKGISQRDITEAIAKSEEMMKIEEKLLNKKISIDIKLSFDRRTR